MISRRSARVSGVPRPDSGQCPESGHGPDTLVVVDQLEEIFTPTGQLAFVLRADCLGAIMQSEMLPHVKLGHRHEVDPLRGPALREAITTAAARVGVELEPALLDRLLVDAADEPGSLPLIQETLVHLWARRERALAAVLTAPPNSRSPSGTSRARGATCSTDVTSSARASSACERRRARWRRDRWHGGAFQNDTAGGPIEWDHQAKKPPAATRRGVCLFFSKKNDPRPVTRSCHAEPDPSRPGPIESLIPLDDSLVKTAG